MSDEYLTPREFSLDEDEEDLGSSVNPVFSDDDPNALPDELSDDLEDEEDEDEDKGSDDDVFDE